MSRVRIRLVALWVQCWSIGLSKVALRATDSNQRCLIPASAAQPSNKAHPRRRTRTPRLPTRVVETFYSPTYGFIRVGCPSDRRAGECGASSWLLPRRLVPSRRSDWSATRGIGRVSSLLSAASRAAQRKPRNGVNPSRGQNSRRSPRTRPLPHDRPAVTVRRFQRRLRGATRR